MLRTIAIATLALCAAAMPAAAACPAPLLETYREAFDEGGSARIPLTINGQTVQAIVCLSCALSELGVKFADRAGVKKIPSSGRLHVEDYDGNPAEFISDSVSISFGNIPFKKPRRFLVSGDHDMAVIGLDLLSYFDVELDPGQRSVTLHGTNTCGRPQAAWAQQAVTLAMKLRYGTLYVGTTLNGKPVEARLWTASPMSTMGFSTAKLHFGLTPQSPGVQKTGTMRFAGSDKVHDLYEYRLPQMVVGGLVFRDVPLKLVDIDDFQFALGNNEINQLHLYLQFGGRDIYAVRADGR